MKKRLTTAVRAAMVEELRRASTQVWRSDHLTPRFDDFYLSRWYMRITGGSLSTWLENNCRDAYYLDPDFVYRGTQALILHWMITELEAGR
jgi:hypothetical protein